MFKWVLILTLVTPANQPDINKQVPMPSLEACIAAEQAWLQGTDPEVFKEQGVHAIWAACVKDKVPGKDL